MQTRRLFVQDAFYVQSRGSPMNKSMNFPTLQAFRYGQPGNGGIGSAGLAGQRKWECSWE